MKVRLPGLLQACQLRFWTVQDLAMHAGITWATADRALAGEPIAARTAAKITAALEAARPSPEAVALLNGHRGLERGEGA
ncbi:MAG TPA: hypothetical protein VFD01_06160 [Candidatus Dormibacteraeota bacterium]|jgi:DNA-binding LacI/PurR family transcriptional regulator|nr:hypothetical protein [Candidatus Dormibacteraeota bacterium]